MADLLNDISVIGYWVASRIAQDDFVMESSNVRSAILGAVGQWCDEHPDGIALCARNLADFATACGDAINEEDPDNDYVLWDSSYRPDDPGRTF